jgi:quercetin dioxygenase-like cupin family protein
MKVQHYREIDPLPVEGIEEATEGLTIRRLISEVDGATEFTMDVFEIEPGGHSAYHEHSWEHQIFVLSGEGTLRGAEGPVQFTAGDVIFIAAGEPHQIVNDGDALVEFVCLIPKAALTAYYMGRAAGRNAASSTI